MQQWRDMNVPIATPSNEACKMYDAVLSQVKTTGLLCRAALSLTLSFSFSLTVHVYVCVHMCVCVCVSVCVFRY